jgi:hypothetical protein
MPERIVGDLSPGSVLLAGPANGLGERLAAGGAEVDAAAGLAEPPARRYDLAIRVGVGGEVPESELANLCAASDRVLLSPAGPAAAAALAGHGYVRDFAADWSALAPGAVLFARAEQPASEAARRYETELNARDEELARLRDRLVAQDEEIGEARGHAAEMEAHAQFLIVIAKRLQNLSPRLFTLLGRVLRRARGLLGAQ